MKIQSFLAAMVIGLWAPSVNALTVLSDIDDTLKIAHVSNAADAAARLLATTAFTGMPELLNGISPQVDHFIYLSARPQALASATAKFISANRFPAGEMIQRRNSEPKEPLEFKSQRIREILISTAAQKEHYVLIGDDTQADPEAYAAVAAEFADRIDAIFIHQISGRALPSAQVPFLISYDLAIHLRNLQLISTKVVEEVTQAVLKENKFQNVLPKFQRCPLIYAAENPSVTDRVNDWCNQGI